MAILYSPDTPYGKELWKWEHFDNETHPTDPTIKGQKPSVHRDYPAMLYKAVGKNPWSFEHGIAADERERDNYLSRGFVMGGPGAAAQAYDAAMQDLALMAAVRNYEDRNLGEKARAESDAVEQASSTHIGEIPRKPIKAKGQKVEGV